jgi:hypothetical protein
MSVYYLSGAPIGQTFTARLVDGNGTILGTTVTVAPLLDSNSNPVEAYTATFTPPAILPVVLEWLDASLNVVGSELVTGAGQPTTDAWFTLEDARALPGPNGGVLSDPAKYPDAMIESFRATAQDSIEHAATVFFTPTAFTDVLDGTTATYTRLVTRKPTSLSTVTLDGTTITDAVLYPDGRLYRAGGWSANAPQTLIVAGIAGYPSCPPRVAHAALMLTKRWLVDTHVSDRATTTTNQDGSSQYFVTAGVKGAMFDVPEVNAVIEDYGIRKGRMVA